MCGIFFYCFHFRLQLFGDVYWKIGCLAYVAFICYDYQTCDSGGRTVGFVNFNNITSNRNKINKLFKLNGLLQHNVHFVFYSVSWVRSFLVWKWILNYFPIDLVKTADLPSDRNYLICVFPHGILR